MAHWEIIPFPPGVKTISQVYLVELEMGGRRGVVLAFDREEADMRKREMSSYLPEEQLEIRGPYVLR